ncbi:MAG TPA: EAL domain-containing response regulator, partial [Candidatus Limnocylindrales bacterium]|nr:EAL domain-containing response regulator [Candidatus Limnocylindrales bacterium]
PASASQPAANKIVVTRPGPEQPVVVVADDADAIRSLFQTALERAGFSVLLASTGRRALELVRSNRVDVLVLDLHMPGLNGLETLRELRADPLLRTLPVIMATGSQVEADRVAGLDQGADDVVIKPLSVVELVARVRSQMRGHAALADELKAGREQRQVLAAVISDLPRDASLIALAAALVDRLPGAIGVDAVGILAFERGGPRCVAASGLLANRFRPGRLLAREVGAGIVARAAEGPWLEARTPTEPGEPAELCFVPFRLASGFPPIGCFVYANGDARGAALGQRVADLGDTTDFAVTALRPAIESAETTNAAILGLRQLIARRRFSVHLQPIVRLATGETFGFEALTRFDDGVRPDVKFAEAAGLGLGRALERATLGAAIEAVQGVPSTLAISLNVGPDVLEHDRSLPELLGRAHRPVIVELTEHERIDNYDAIRAGFARLGPDVRLAVDDAGSGYASLRHILSLQPSYVKLDIEWVRGIDRDPVRRSLVSGLAYFAQATGSELIAEGIESEDERLTLLELGVPLGQGYLLGRPVPSATALREAPD